MNMGMKKLPKKLKVKDYVALLCDATKGDWLVCGVYASQADALKVKERIRACAGHHITKKCSVIISL